MRRVIPVLVFLTVLAAPQIAHAQQDGWDMQFTAGSPNIESGIRFVPMTPIDGAAKLVQQAGRACLTTDYKLNNGYIYFDVSRKGLLAKGNPPYTLEIAVDYLDSGTDSFAIQYDAMGTDVADNFRERDWRKTGTGEWKRAIFRLTDAEFRNGQSGSADFRIASGADGDEFISGVAVRVISGSPGAQDAHKMLPERTLAARKWVTVPMQSTTIVIPDRLSEAERIALDRLVARFRYLGAPVPKIAHGMPRNIVSGRTCLVVGVGGEVVRFPGGPTLLATLKSSPERFKAEQGYTMAAADTSTGGRMVLATGAGTMGAVFAMAHLETHLWYDGASLNLHLDRRSGVESPAFRDRELYINIGYGLGRERITTETWTLQEWKDYIDKLVLARYNSWSFYLWGDSELAYPGSTVNRETNIRVHKTIQQAIDYSHKRGLKVGFHITSTLVPLDIWDKHPELHSRLEYPWTGIICPSKEASWPIMTDVYTNELRWFKGCDFISIWFYDAGGCFCDQCKVADQQLATITREVTTLTGIAKKVNPSVRIQVMTWGIWRYERMHNYNIRARFMQKMADFFGKGNKDVVFADGIYIDPGVQPLFREISAQGFDKKTFLYQTNIEDGQPFPILQTRYFEKWTNESLKVGAKGIFPMRIEAGSKYPDDFVGGSIFWNPSSKGVEAIRDYAYWTTGDSSAAPKLAQALIDTDDFAWYGFLGGGADAKRGERISGLVKSAVDSLPRSRRDDLDWLVAVGEAYRIIGKGVEAKDMEDAEALNTLNGEFLRAVSSARLFHAQGTAAPWSQFFKNTYVNEYYNGWSSTHF